ncbi:MAG: SDR family oxidoreductase, partial [Alphaproteobacteria bacterium]|nr:SDR family oxidoreductase [Alphaproteobacteria bacterium]
MPAKKATSRRRAIGIAAAASLATSARAQNQRTVLITGANRGLGLEFVKQYLARGYRIIGTARKPSEAKELNDIAKANASISVETLDVTSVKSIDAMAARLKGVAIDILINNAGVIGEPEKENWGSIPYDHFDQVMNTNVKGPLRVSEALIENVAASAEKKIAVVTSVEGSIASVRAYARPFYRASKAAVNMVMRNVAMAVKDRGILIVLVCPGGTDTDMTAFFRGKFKMREVPVAVADMVRLIDQVS